MIFRPYFVLFVSPKCLEALLFLQCGFGVLFRFLYRRGSRELYPRQIGIASVSQLGGSRELTGSPFGYRDESVRRAIEIYFQRLCREIGHSCLRRTVCLYFCPICHSRHIAPRSTV